MEANVSCNQLLPKSKADFATKDYWDRFFTKRTAAFEWYGEFYQISPVIFKYAKQNDKLLVVGCGNSTMSQDLYRSGYTSVVSVDISDVVIKQMKKKYPKLDFRTMDATNLEFSDSEFGIVIDKGTTDALLPSDAPDKIEVAHKVFSEVARCLRFGGRFICVSLLQDHVAGAVFDYFRTKSAQDTTWVVRVHRCEDCKTCDSSLILPVYILVCTKMKRLPTGPCVLELMIGDKAMRYTSAEDLCKEIKEQQNFAFLKNHVNKTTLTEEFHTQLFSTEDTQNPKYELFIVDTPDSDTQCKLACFLVPEGREVEWLYGTPEGRKITAKQCGATRVIFVHLNRVFTYGSQQDIQDELSDAIQEMVPRNFKEGVRIPFMSLGDSAGTRNVLEKGHSDLSGTFVVEDVRVYHETFRRLVFCGRQSVIQTEMRITAGGELDFSYLSGEYYRYMLVALGYFDQPGSALLLGLGGGTLASFISKFTEWKVEAVELDPAIVEVARKYFGLPESTITHVQDAFKFIKETTGTFEVILLDIDSKNVGQAMTCPPEEFLEEDFLDNVVKRLTEKGIFVVNLACRDESKCLEVYRTLQKKFQYLSRVDISEDVNKIIMASNVCKFDSVQKLIETSQGKNEISNLSRMMESVDVAKDEQKNTERLHR
ncbi:eEF1A lysine and N-terminal methyltransferase [Galendromus occidentalis]|uniref:EEF1A lysine and N-terminal methyltransferase n=1 Tax=Galendromus occidentalis TaxID=34638 RepID=A0AAJ6VVW0_9ACAR|nr:eEF1A lysine and N-terminal methyltransferase [Galendromus occidentalis]